MKVTGSSQKLDRWIHVCCSVLQYVAGQFSVLLCSVLQCAAVCVENRTKNGTSWIKSRA